MNEPVGATAALLYPITPTTTSSAGNVALDDEHYNLFSESVNFVLMNISNNSTNGTVTETQPIDLFFSLSLGLTVVCGLLFSYLILRHYTKHSPLSWFLYIPLVLTFSLLFTSVCMVCIDLAAARSVDMSSAKTDANRALEIAWRVIYWTCFVLAQVLLPLFKGYQFTGEFKGIFKLLKSIVMNLLTISVMLGIGVAGLAGFLIYIAVVDDIKNVTFNMLLGLALSLSNLVGLSLLITLLGYGIVVLPRTLWEISNDQRQLRMYEFKTVGLLENLNDTEDEVIELISVCKKLHSTVPENHKERKNVLRMMKTVDKVIEDHPQLQNARLRDRFEPGLLPAVETLTRWQLVNIHKNLVNAILEFSINQYQWKHLQIQAFILQDIVDSKSNGSRKIDSPFRRWRFSFVQKMLQFPEWLFRKFIRPWFLKLVAVVYVLFSLILLWCQFTPLFKNVTTVKLSVLEMLISSIGDRFVVQFVALGIISVILATVLVALFNVRVMEYFRLIPGHTDSYSLFYTAQLLCRVIPSMMFNFLQLIGVSKNDGVAYFNIYGELRMDGLLKFGVIGGFIVDYLPLGIFLVVFVAAFRILERLGTLINIERFKYSGTEKVTDERVLEGREILARVRERKLKHIEKAKEENRDGSFSITKLFDKLDEHDVGSGSSKKKSSKRKQNEDDDDSDTIKFSDKFLEDIDQFAEKPSERHYQSGSKKEKSKPRGFSRMDDEEVSMDDDIPLNSYRPHDDLINKIRSNRSKKFESVL